MLRSAQHDRAMEVADASLSLSMTEQAQNADSTTFNKTHCQTAVS